MSISDPFFGGVVGLNQAVCMGIIRVVKAYGDILPPEYQVSLPGT